MLFYEVDPHTNVLTDDVGSTLIKKAGFRALSKTRLSMVTFFSIAIVMLAIGILSYFTSARFGVKASNTDKMPPYYEHLLRRLKEKEKQGEGIEKGIQHDEVSPKR